jgi:SH3 domain-containing protein
MTAVANFDENFALKSFPGFITDPEFGRAAGYQYKKESGYFSGGLLSGILAILLLLYFGGGPYALRPITFVADRKAKEKYLEEQRYLQDRTTNGGGGPLTPPSAFYQIRTENVNMRICPGLDCEPIYTLQPGMQIADARGREYRDNIEWIRVSVNGREGWVSRNLLIAPGDAPPPQRPPDVAGPNNLRVRISDIWLRECPGLNCREVEPLPLGALVANLGQSKPVDAEWWIKIRYGNREGWVVRNTLE